MTTNKKIIFGVIIIAATIIVVGLLFAMLKQTQTTQSSNNGKFILTLEPEQIKMETDEERNITVHIKSTRYQGNVTGPFLLWSFSGEKPSLDFQWTTNMPTTFIEVDDEVAFTLSLKWTLVQNETLEERW
jgi:hypothetical protein